ncbi:RNA polymerase subunit sigma-24 [Pedobacter sp. Hv1]|nr:RNA polymerase subunit sigma-24 [Pedobacter sp. Hv1]
MNIVDEQSLFALLRQGDESAFEQIYKLYWAQLFNTAYKRLPETEKCKDIIQNVFTDLWNRRATLDLANPAAYLHTAVRFQVLKQISKNSKSSAFTATFETELISPLATDGEVLEKEVRVLIELFIKALPQKRREMFLMHYFKGLSTSQIATQLNVSQKTVQNQLTTASNALRLRLTQLLLSMLILLVLFS